MAARPDRLSRPAIARLRASIDWVRLLSGRLGDPLTEISGDVYLAFTDRTKFAPAAIEGVSVQPVVRPGSPDTFECLEV
ncbi:hypothetical protein GCM10007977_074270 [Dactylosporangium sucinum]|uniref:Uncharacterized protein n=1 Tax=Dactylosporangium sucinum TaxID=1424081 RepID=A0A917U994_9ACTN|nr:hypothetical protein GCM10007977_074270 [Dactylosporangium sucinum]